MKIIQVKAANGVRVPTEQDARQYITDAESVEVELTNYYRRRIVDGDLIEQHTKAQEKDHGIA
ncbi:MAG: DUF2635 domain-containing protein [Gammaproteobacteria bacterium]|nr:DUF2635 domain-containing protein [Gammaproteobacteria bacterium]